MVLILSVFEAREKFNFSGDFINKTTSVTNGVSTPKTRNARYQKE